jgi:hypothetical protein
MANRATDIFKPVITMNCPSIVRVRQRQHLTRGGGWSVAQPRSGKLRLCRNFDLLVSGTKKLHPSSLIFS